MSNEVDRIIDRLAQRLGATPGRVRKSFELDPFQYTITFLPLAASITATANFLVQADSGFAIVKTTGTYSAITTEAFVANISDTPYFTPFLVTLSDSGSGRDLSDQPVPVNSLFGTGMRPVIWPIPKVLDPNSTFSARIQNLVATAFQVRLSFHGFKIFGNYGDYKALRK